jgi:hypothetical protein
MSPTFRPSCGIEKLCAIEPLFVIRMVPPVSGNEIICGVILNSDRETSTTAEAEDASAVPVAPDADPLRNPNIASAKAVTETMNANQPSTDLSSFAMGAMVTTNVRTK